LTWISDPRGFKYTISAEKTTVTAKTDTSVNEYILEVHLKALESLQNHLLRCAAPSSEIANFARLLSAGQLKRFLLKTRWRINRLAGKFYKFIQGKRIMGDERLSKEPKKDLFADLLKTDWLTPGKEIQWDKLGEQLQKDIKKGIVDLTTLTIATTGVGGKKIETNIKLTGDIESTNEVLSGDELVAYHERMAKLSIDIMKTYAQIFIQIISVFVPWAGIKIPDDVLKNLQDLIKGISLSPAASK
jgi:hypothetical protein